MTFITELGEGRKAGRERGLLLSWAKAGKDSEGRSKATRSEGDDLEESAARALIRAMGGEDVVGEVKGVEEARERDFWIFNCWWALFGSRAAGKRQ